MCSSEALRALLNTVINFTCNNVYALYLLLLPNKLLLLLLLINIENEVHYNITDNNMKPYL